MDKKEKFFKSFMTLLFIAFIGICISNKTGYKEYEMHKRVELTKEQIEKFESDVKNNRNIDINNYVNDTKEDYSNEMSKISLSFSNFTSKYIKKGISDVFDVLSKFLS